MQRREFLIGAGAVVVTVAVGVPALANEVKVDWVGSVLAKDLMEPNWQGWIWITDARISDKFRQVTVTNFKHKLICKYGDALTADLKAVYGLSAYETISEALVKQIKGPDPQRDEGTGHPNITLVPLPKPIAPYLSKGSGWRVEPIAPYTRRYFWISYDTETCEGTFNVPPGRRLSQT